MITRDRLPQPPSPPSRDSSSRMTSRGKPLPIQWIRPHYTEPSPVSNPRLPCGASEKMPKTSLSLAKTTRPTLSQVLERERLFTRLDDCLRSPAVWIAGPPGCGKSTLIASYAQARNMESLWYQVDDSDNDIATFFHYLRHTIEKHSRLPGEEIPDLPLGAADWSKYGRGFLRGRVSRFVAPVSVIFENYEALPANSELHALRSEQRR